MDDSPKLPASITWQFECKSGRFYLSRDWPDRLVEAAKAGGVAYRPSDGFHDYPMMISISEASDEEGDGGDAAFAISLQEATALRDALTKLLALP